MCQRRRSRVGRISTVGRWAEEWQLQAAHRSTASQSRSDGRRHFPKYKEGPKDRRTAGQRKSLFHLESEAYGSACRCRNWAVGCQEREGWCGRSFDDIPAIISEAGESSGRPDSISSVGIPVERKEEVVSDSSVDIELNVKLSSCSNVKGRDGCASHSELGITGKR